MRPSQRSARSWLENRWLYIAAGVSLAAGIAALVRRQRISQPLVRPARSAGHAKRNRRRACAQSRKYRFIKV